MCYLPLWGTFGHFLSFDRIVIVYRFIENTIEIPSFLRLDNFFLSNDTPKLAVRYSKTTYKSIPPTILVPRINSANSVWCAFNSLRMFVFCRPARSGWHLIANAAMCHIIRVFRFMTTAQRSSLHERVRYQHY